MNKLSPELIQQVVQLRVVKLSYDQIAEKLGIPKNQAEHAGRLGGAVKKKLTSEQIEEIKNKRRQGVIFEDLSKDYGVSRGTLIRMCKGVDTSHLKTDKKQLIQDYKAGMSMAEIAFKHQLAERSVSSVIHREGAASRKNKVSAATKEKAAQQRELGVSVKEIASELGISPATVKKTAKEAGVKVDQEVSQRNAYVAKLKKNPNAMEDIRKGLTQEVVRLRSEKIAEKYKKDVSLAEEASKRANERWRGFTDNERVAAIQKIQEAIESSEKTAEYRQRLATQVLDQNPYNKSILTATGHETMFQYFNSLAIKKGGLLVGPYAGSHTKTEWKCNKNHSWWALPNSVQQGSWCPSCAYVGPSRAQIEIYEYVQSLIPGQEVRLGDRQTIKNPETGRHLELDVYVPSVKFAVEFNGLLFHSDYFENQQGRHYKKAMACREAGVRLLAIFEDEWENKRELIKAMIRHRLGLQSSKLRASALELVRLTKNSEFKAFFERNHLDGHAMATSAIGLVQKGELKSCMSFRVNHQGELEIARFATDYDVHIHGAASRILSHLKPPLGEALVTFSNNRLSTGDVYSKLGFQLVQENKSSYYYTDGKVRVWRFKCKRINDPEVLTKFPDVPHTEKSQALNGVFSEQLFGDRRPLYKIEDYGHRKWIKP